MSFFFLVLMKSKNRRVIAIIIADFISLAITFIFNLLIIVKSVKEYFLQ